ncbi:MAG: hypothetical protein AAGA91_18845 [Pseudomonadota bacterium]
MKTTSAPTINTSSQSVAIEQLLDVGIVIFNPGIDDFDAEDEDTRIYPEVRKAEARFMARQLANAMEESGAWGPVRLIPDAEQFTDLTVQGRILLSDGESLELAIEAHDSRGNVWLDKTYPGQASRYAYEATTLTRTDPFQAVYNTIANDLLAAQETLRTEDRENIRLVTELLFAQSFAPDAFSGYLAKNPRGNYLVMRLPAEDDPMLQRTESIREKDRVFIDTLQGYYSNFDQQMIKPYEEWRKASYEETMLLQEYQQKSRQRLVTGAVAVAAGVAGLASDSAAARSAGALGVYSGGVLLKSGLELRNEASLHAEALNELGMTLDAEITPQVIELEDRTVTLVGNVEEQYAQWRDLLAEIYRVEVGDLEDYENAGTDTAQQ